MECMRADETAIRGAKNAEEMLYRGFTTVRDAGGLVWGNQALYRYWLHYWSKNLSKSLWYRANQRSL